MDKGNVPDRIRIPGSGESGRGIERGNGPTCLPTDASEGAARVDRGPAYCQGIGNAVRVRVPSGGEPPTNSPPAPPPGWATGRGGGGFRTRGGGAPGRNIERANPFPCLPADGGEAPARVERRPFHRHKTHLAVCVRVPGGDAACS